MTMALLLQFDAALRDHWKSSFIGVDEAGRGPLAGPVAAAAVVLPPDHGIEGLRDSKKLSSSERERLALLIREKADVWAIAWVSPADIDEMNILNASLSAMCQAIKMTGKEYPVIVDGNQKIPGLPNVQKSVVQGDARSATVAAASILAKTERDRYMENMAKTYPVYGFEKHKGYPTREHYRLLRAHGPCRIHRKTFKGVLS